MDKTAANLPHAARLMIGRASGQVARKRAIRNAWRQAFGDACGCGTVMCFEGFYPWKAAAATIDHIKPRAVGGGDALKNLRVICNACNNAKARGDQTLAAAVRKSRLAKGLPPIPGYPETWRGYLDGERP